MSDRWLEYFGDQKSDNPEWLRTAVDHWSFMQHLYGEIQRTVPKGSRILDIGCGMGYSDLYLGSYGYKVTGIDNDHRIVDRAITFGRQLGIDATFRQADAFDLSGEHGKHDLVFSVGVLEHFDREVTIQLLQEQARCASYVLICIPTKYTTYAAPITDERIYRIPQLRDIVSDAGLNVVRSFGYGDVTATTKQIWLKRLLPHAVYRMMQNRGFAFNICVIGESKTFQPATDIK